MTQAYNPGEAKITLFDLTSLDGSIRQSIINQVISFDIYESIMLPLMVCDIAVKDSIGLIDQFPIIGEEFVEIEVKNPETQNAYFFKFKTVSVTNKVTNPDGKMMSYIIRCMSEEIIENSKKRIQKRFTGLSPYEMISQIVQNDLKSTKKLFVDDAPIKGNESIFVNNLAPMQAVDMIRRRTVTSKYQSSAYNFFENRDGFNFVTIDKMMITGKQSIGDRIFFYDSHTNSKVENINIRNILAYRQVASANPVDFVQSGAVSNITQSLDIRTGSISTVNFNLKDNLDKFTQADKSGISAKATSVFMNRAGSKVSEIENPLQLFSPKSSKNGDSFREDKLGFLQSYVSQLVGNIVRVLVYGDTTLTAGAVITLKFPDVSGTTDKKDDSRLASGNYLISKIRHTFVNADKTYYKCSMECIKPSFGESDV